MENPKRLAILRILVDAEIPVGELAHRVGLSQSALSQHLAKLRKAGKKPVLVSYSTSSRERLSGLLKDHGLTALAFADSW